MTYEEQLQIEQLNREIEQKIYDTVLAEDFINFYINNTRKETIEHFKLRNERQLLRILNHFGYDFSTKKPSKLKGKKATRTHDSYIAGGKKSAETQKQHWEEKSKEEKDAWSIKQSLAHLNLPTFKDKITLSNRAYRASLTDEQRLAIDAQRSESMKTWWEQLSDEEKAAILENRFKNGQTYNQKDSAPNLYFASLLEQNNIAFEREYCLDKKFFDFKINNILVEINPTFTHNSTFTPFKYNSPLDKKYHAAKTEIANKHGFRCIHIFDWEDKEKVIKLLQADREQIYARQCEVREVSKQDTIDFLYLNHLQGYAKDHIRLGLYYNKELVAIMTFGKPRYNHNYEYELIRYCASKNITGGAEKLLKHFIAQYSAKSIISYCDLSKFSGRTYEKLNFKLLKKSGPAKHWYNIKTKEHYTDNLLRQRGFSQLINKKTAEADNLVGASNAELMINAGFVEIYDCGQATYIWKAEE